jgi:glucose 1-dehydrogenase
VPHELAHIGVLMEPRSVVEKALRQANLIQRRMNSWNPKNALVLGAGPIGLLGTLLLRSRGIDVVTMARRPGPHLVSEIVEAAGARYAAMEEVSIHEVAAALPSIDLIFEATGNAAPGFAAMEILGDNGVLVLLSGASRPAELTVPAAAINSSLLRGNKVVVGSVNSAREDFEAGVEDLSRFETLWPGLASRLITRHLNGLDDYASILDKPEGDIKTVIDVDEGFRVAG